MPLPPTESLSVSAPTLYFSVSCRPFRRSTMKKRWSFSMNFGFGTLTKGITSFPIADFRLPIDGRWREPLEHRTQLTIGNCQSPMSSFACSGSNSRDRRLALRQVHQLDVSTLTLQ